MAIRVQDILWVRTLQRGSKFPDQFSGYFTGIKLVDHDTLMTTFTDERDLRVVSLVSKDNGFTWTEWTTLHDSARDLVGWNGMGTAQGLFKSGIGSPTPGLASIGVDWTAFTSIVGPQPAAGGIFTAEISNHHHWKKVWDGLIIPYNVSVPWADFGITCGWANLPNARLACGEYAADDIHPAYFPDGLFYLVKTQSSSGRSGWTPHGGDARLYLEDWATNSFNLDGIMTVYPVFNHPHPLLGNDRTILTGAHMTSRRPRMFWNLEGGYGGIRESSLASDQFNRRVSNWHEVRLPPTLGTFEEFLFSTYVNSFAHLGNGVILAGGGAPTIVPGDEGKPFGSRTYYHYPQLWRSNNPPEDPLDTWENISLNIGHFAATLPISGPTQYRVTEILSLGDGNALLGLYVAGPNDFPFWFTNDYGDSFPSPGIFSRPEAVDRQIVTQMTLTPAGLIAASMFVSYVDYLSGDEIQGTDWQTLSNQAHNAGTGGWTRARLEIDRASDDHYAQGVAVACSAGVGGVAAIGVFCRKDATLTQTFYGFWALNGGIVEHRLRKVVANAETVLDTAVDTFSANEVIKVQADGSTIKGFIDSTEKTSATDTGITGFLRCGIAAFGNQSPTANTLDDFEAGDLAVGGRIFVKCAGVGGGLVGSRGALVG